MSKVENQSRIFLEFLAQLRPHWRRDISLPERVESLFRCDRRLGSRDRRLYRELVYTTLRYLSWVEPLLDRAPDQAVAAVAWLAAETSSTREFRAALAFSQEPVPATVAAKAAIVAGIAEAPAGEPLLPLWFESECPEAFVPPNYDVLNTRAPLWVRLQSDDTAAVLAEFSRHGWAWRECRGMPGALELPAESEVTGTDAYRRGLVEIQDVGSQLILETVGVEPGGWWLDACAGAGGKALQLARLLGPGGRVDACDVRVGALEELGRRAARAGLTDQIFRPAAPKSCYDGVLVDAPCSGSGTWRRAPHLKWVCNPARVAAHSRRQRALLAHYSALVRPGGRLVYATCSLCRTENDRVIDNFLNDFPDFAPSPFANPQGGEPRGQGFIFWPAAHDGDGYFCASLVRRKS